MRYSCELIFSLPPIKKPVSSCLLSPLTLLAVCRFRLKRSNVDGNLTLFFFIKVQIYETLAAALKKTLHE